MVSVETFRKLALSFPDVSEEAHFEKISFRIKKKIFATFDEKNNRAVVKLDQIDQSVFCASSEMICCPVPNKWGKQGWTIVELSKVRPEMFEDALIDLMKMCDQQKSNFLFYNRSKSQIYPRFRSGFSGR